jgi:hypothetical protein
MHFGPLCGLLHGMTDTELATELRSCRRRLRAVAALLVIAPVLLSALFVAIR